jgi:4-alpha-glucanotransferase
VLANIEDGLEEISQTNLPGTVENHPNWRRKYASSIENLVDDERLRELGATLRSTRPIS